MSAGPASIARRQLLRAAVIVSGLGAGALGRLEQGRLQATVTHSAQGSQLGVTVQPIPSAVPQAGWVLPEVLPPSQVGELRSQGSLQVGVPIANTVAHLKGAPLWQAEYQLTIQSQNATAEMHILDIRAIILRRSTPLEATLLWDPEVAVTQSLRNPTSQIGTVSAHIATVSAMNPVGAVQAIALQLDLDSKIPVITAASNGPPFFSDYTITLTPGQVVVLNLTAQSNKFSVDFDLSLDVLRAASSSSVEISAYGGSFRVSAGAGNWPSRAQPDFAAYRSLYVASGPSTNPQWIARDPQRYVPPTHAEALPGGQ